MTKVVVDENTCIGCGLCANSCPDVFEMTGEGVAKVKANESSECEITDVIAQCPVNCISLEE